MEHKVFDQNAYRRAYYRANPDKKLIQEEKNAVRLLNSLGYSIPAPPPEQRAAAFEAVIATRMQRRKERAQHG